MTPMPILREKLSAVHEVGAPFGTPLLYLTQPMKQDNCTYRSSCNRKKPIAGPKLCRSGVS